MPASRRRRWTPFTVPHFREYVSRLVWDDGEQRELEGWQLDWVRDLFRGRGFAAEHWLLVPEANGKTSLLAAVGLYGLDFAPLPWIPVGAHNRDQAFTLYNQAKVFVDSTPGLKLRFQCLDGMRVIRSLRNGGKGMEVRPWEPASNDGVIPFPYALLDELHRHEDLSLYRLWKGKLRKRGAQLAVISTAGEPGTEFEEQRDRLRELAVSRRPKGGCVRFVGGGVCLHEFMVQNPDHVKDPKVVAKANPLSVNTPAVFAEDLASATFDLGDFKRLKANIAARSVHAAITDEEWAAFASMLDAVPEGERIDVGLDLGWKWDTTALAPLWQGPDFRLLDEAVVIRPPRDGSSTHPDRVKEAFITLNDRNPIDLVAMDLNSGEDVASWLEDELGVRVSDHPQGNDGKVDDYANFMRGMRNGTLKRVVRCPNLTRQAMNAVARRLPRGDHRFDRPSSTRHNVKKQDIRVIDALDASAMVNTATGATVSAVPMVALA